MQHWELLLFFLVIAFVYSSVGFGGASSYLAILGIYELPVYEMKLISLVCNIVVVTGGSILFVMYKQVNIKKIAPLIICSVPMAFLGAKMKISTDTFFILLGCNLIAASLLMFIKTRATEEANVNNSSIFKNSVLGGGVGFLSGLVGIGGGIFLSPLLHLSKWDIPKKIAATASVFILVNSISSLSAHLSRPDAGPVNYYLILLLSAAVFAGGQLGSRVGVSKFNPVTIKRVTAVLVFAAGIEVLYKHLHLFRP